jgi:hypothetical protein
MVLPGRAGRLTTKNGVTRPARAVFERRGLPLPGGRGDAAAAAVEVRLARIVTSHRRASASHQTREENRRLCF